MSDAPQQQPPNWLARFTARQAFVVTLCSAVSLDEAVSGFYAAAGHLPILDKREYERNSCSLVVECDADEAWALLQTLRARLSNTDVYLQPRAAEPIRLLICDMDMTIVAAETLDEVAAELGLGERIAAITTRAMNGEIDFDNALRERIAMLEGQPEQVFYDVGEKLEMNPGAHDLVAAAKQAGVRSVLVSGGFAQVAEVVAVRLGFDEVFCNQLDVVDGRLSGKVHDPIVNAAFKRDVMQRLAEALDSGLEHCCAIGDGANDLPMIRDAGLGIAYRGKPILRAASACHIDYTDLSSAARFMRL